MANHRKRAQFERARWRRPALFAAWAVQLPLSVAIMGLFSWRLGDSTKHYTDKEKNGEVPTIELVWEVVNVALSFVIASCTLGEISRYMSETLTPWTMLFTHVMKLTSGLAILGLDIVLLVQKRETPYAIVSLAIDSVLLIVAIAIGSYAAVTYHRLSSFDEYAHPSNVKAFGFRDGIERGDSQSDRLPLRASIDKRFSSVSSRLSIGSAISAATTTDSQALSNQLQRTPSYYNHERDTQFDVYLARRGSVLGTDTARSNSTASNGSGSSTVRGDEENGLAVESGWLSPTTPETDSDAATGVGGSMWARPRGASAPRAPSWTSDHVLVPVLEQEEEEGHGKKVAGDSDQASLLGKRRRVSDIPLVSPLDDSSKQLGWLERTKSLR